MVLFLNISLTGASCHRFNFLASSNGLCIWIVSKILDEDNHFGRELIYLIHTTGVAGGLLYTVFDQVMVSIHVHTLLTRNCLRLETQTLTEFSPQLGYNE